MPKLDLPPGLYRQATEYSAVGRYYDAQLIRWVIEGNTAYIRPIPGWDTGLAGTLSGNPRAAHCWLDNEEASFAAFGTHSKLYAHDGTTLDDITPSGFTATDANASTWTLDNFGELLIACNDEDETIYEWQPGGAGDATAVTNAPAAKAILVTEEKFIVAFATDGDPRALAWCDQENRTQWTATSTNQAGDLPTHSIGKLMCGAKIRGGFLAFTTEGLYLGRYIGQPDIYGLEHVTNGCGIVGRNAKVEAAGSEVFWMGRDAFWVWRGYVDKVPCDISDDLFSNINPLHRHKVWGFHNSRYTEVWFFYPRGSATECSHYAVFNYKGGFWNHGQLSRLCGFAEGVFSNPILVNASGEMLRHEYGWSYEGNDGVVAHLLDDDEETHLTDDDGTTLLTDGGAHVRYLRSGPAEIGEGERRMMIDEIIPDEANQGDCSVTFYLREYPNAAETEIGPFSSADRVGVFATARQASIEYVAGGDVEDFRIGSYRVNMKARGRY